MEVIILFCGNRNEMFLHFYWPDRNIINCGFNANQTYLFVLYTFSKGSALSEGGGPSASLLTTLFIVFLHCKSALAV